MRRSLLLSAVLCLVLAPAAYADTEVGQIELGAAVSVSTVETTTVLGGCPQTNRDDDGGLVHTVKKPIKNVFGTTLVAYFQRVKWCFTGNTWFPQHGGKITWIDRDRWGEVYAAGWDYEGHIDAWGYGGRGDVKALRGTQGKFRFCPGPAGCLQTKTPWIQHVVWGYGGYEWNTGGTG